MPTYWELWPGRRLDNPQVFVASVDEEYDVAGGVVWLGKASLLASTEVFVIRCLELSVECKY